MIEYYINDFNVFIKDTLFFCFKYGVIFFVILLLISLILLAAGCLIKSQTVKSKFLITVPFLILWNIFLLLLPYIFVNIKNLF